MHLFKAGDVVRQINTGALFTLTEFAPLHGRERLQCGNMKIFTDGTGHLSGILRVEHITKSKQMKSWVIK